MTRFLLSVLLLPLASSGILKANDQDPTPRVIPMTSPWDANAWEPGSASSFWRVQAPQAPGSSSEVKTVPAAPAVKGEKSKQTGTTSK